MDLLLEVRQSAKISDLSRPSKPLEPPSARTGSALTWVAASGRGAKLVQGPLDRPEVPDEVLERDLPAVPKRTVLTVVIHRGSTGLSNSTLRRRERRWTSSHAFSNMSIATLEAREPRDLVRLEIRAFAASSSIRNRGRMRLRTASAPAASRR